MIEGLELLHVAGPWMGVAVSYQARGLGTHLRARVPILTPSGVRVHFGLSVSTPLTGTVHVREVVLGTELPACCPERHINFDGSFCLGLEVPTPASEGEAIAWWSLLLGFLEMQLDARILRRWGQRSWRHGYAGVLQRELEDKCRAVPVELRRIFELRAPIGADRRGAGRTGRSSHARALEELADLLDQVETAERRYWQDLVDKELTCCGTMDSCPLARAGPAPIILAASDATHGLGAGR